MKRNLVLLVGIFVVLSLVSPMVFAQDIKDTVTSGIGIDTNGIITIGSSILASVLFVLTFVAYRRDKRKRLLYVAVAFFLFAVKGILLSIDLFSPPKGTWTDPIGYLLDFAILLSFFFGVVKKGG